MAFGEVSRANGRCVAVYIIGMGFLCLKGFRLNTRNFIRVSLAYGGFFEKNPLYDCFPARLDIFLALLDTRAFWYAERTVGHI